MVQTGEQRSDGGNPQYQVVETVRDPDGVVAVITERKSDGLMSFGLYREFERNGETTKSSYMSRRHLPAVRRLLADLEDRLELLEDRTRAKRREK